MDSKSLGLLGLGVSLVGLVIGLKKSDAEKTERNEYINKAIEKAVDARLNKDKRFIKPPVFQNKTLLFFIKKLYKEE